MDILHLLPVLFGNPVDIVIWVVLFYWLAVFCLAVYCAHLKKLLSWWHYVVFCVPVVVFLVVDCLTNLTLAWWLFRDPPQELLITQRLSRYRNTLPEFDIKHRIAAWICDRNLNIFDPEHC